LVVSHGKSGHSKHSVTPRLNAQVQIAQNLLSLGMQPSGPAGQVPAVMRGHFSQAIPQTLIRIISSSKND
jgi:hypothetical protein